MNFEKMWRTVTSVAKSNHLVYVGKDGNEYSIPFAALSPSDKTIARRWWSRWHKRPDAGKKKAQRGEYGVGKPPHP